MTVLLICTVVCFLAACITYASTKKIAALVYIKTVQVHENIQADLPKSPYSLQPAGSSKTNRSGWALTKNGKLMNIAGSETKFEIHYTLEGALAQLNLLEKLEGYKLTTLE